MHRKTQTHRRWAASSPGCPLSHSQPTGKREVQGPPHPKGPGAVGLRPSESRLSTCWGKPAPQGGQADEPGSRGNCSASYGGCTEPAV